MKTIKVPLNVYERYIKNTDHSCSTFYRYDRGEDYGCKVCMLRPLVHSSIFGVPGNCDIFKINNYKFIPDTFTIVHKLGKLFYS